MPCNSTVSNKRDLNRDSCILLWCGSFTITGGVALGLKRIQSRTQPGEIELRTKKNIELFEVVKFRV